MDILKQDNMLPWMLGHQWIGDTPGARLRQARLKNNMTIRDLSRTSRLSICAIFKLETDRNNASLSNLRSLSEILGVP
ncbi:MAG: helix-turn-helix transcriptional regulator, partial [Peptococcaceae bacterium]|nr:helix-turn-helix transcriptional regulator [Peptococcaceae bacterium]